MIDKNNITLVLQELERFATTLETRIISDPCCQFKVLQDLYKLVTRYVTIADINTEVSRLIGDYSRFKLLKTLHAKFAIVALYHCCKYQLDGKIVLYVLGLVYYKLLINKYIPYCDISRLQTSLSLQRRSSSFKKLGSNVVNLVEYVVQQVYQRYTDRVRSTCDEPSVYIVTLYELRTRIAQKVKSIAKRYYETKQVKSQNTSLNTYVNSIYNRIMVYGDVKRVSGCTYLYTKLTQLPQTPADLVRDSIFEVLSVFGVTPKIITSRQVNRALRNNDLKATLTVLNYLSVEPTTKNIICLVKTYYASLR